MIAFAWILLLASSTRVQVVDEDYRIAAADWQWVPVSLKQQPGFLSAHYLVRSSSGQVSGKVSARARSVVDTQRLTISGSFRNVTLRSDPAECGHAVSSGGPNAAAEPEDTSVH